jgi:hypothetical protein
MVWIRNPLSDVGQRRVSEYGQDGNKTKMETKPLHHHDKWILGGQENTFPLGFNSLANGSGSLNFCFYYLPTNKQLALNPKP